MTSRLPQELEGKDAVDYAERHLRKLRVNSQTWEIEYRRPDDRGEMDNGLSSQ